MTLIRMRSRSCLGTGLAVLGMGAAVANAADPEVSLRVAAMSGQQVPGLANGVVFSSFDSTNNSFSWDTGPVLNGSGDLAFRADFREGFVPAGKGICTRLAGVLGVAAREGAPAPGTAVNFLSFSPPLLNGAGHIAFVGRLESSPFVTDYGIWSSVTGTLTLAAREGDPAPGVGVGVLFGDLEPQTYTLHLNNNDHLAFDAGLAGAGVTASNDLAIFTTHPATLALVAREGSQAPGLAPGVVHADDGAFLEFGFNDPGDLVFVTRLSGPGVTSTVNDSAIFHGGTGAPVLVHRASEAVPGVAAPGVSRILFSDVRIDTAGQAIFLASFREPPSNIVRVGVFAGSFTAGLQLLAAEGEPAPGAGTTFATLGAFSNLARSASGNVAFEARLANGDRAIFTDLSGSLTMLVRTGQQPPGAPPGSAFNFFHRISLNNDHRIVVPAAVTIPGGPAVNGVWMNDSSGALRQVIRAGDTIDINPDPNVTDSRVVRDFAFRSTPSARGLSDASEVAMGVLFRDPDPSGFFVWAILLASIDEGCPADLDDGSGTGAQDGGVTIDDLVYFIGQFTAGSTEADLDDGSGTGTQDGGVTIDDLVYFIEHFTLGC
jgi:hypothetical protein